MNTRTFIRRRRAPGVALIMTVIVLVLAGVLMLALARAALNAERSAGAERDRVLAMAAAEAALRDAEADIEGADPRRAPFFDGSGAGFVEACGALTHPNAGLCWPPAAALPAVDFDSADAHARSVPYGRFTARVLQTGTGPLPRRLPRYVIELLRPAVAGEDAGRRAPVYRITAAGFGADAETRVLLQAYYRRAAP